MTDQIRRVGVIGLGAMGMGIAQWLLRAGFEVHACDVRSEAVAKIVEAGAQGADTPAALGPRVEALVPDFPDAGFGTDDRRMGATLINVRPLLSRACLRTILSDLMPRWLSSDEGVHRVRSA